MAKVKVSNDVLKGLDALMKSGRTQLNDLANVIHHLEAMGEYPASDWVQNNWELYEQGIREGFEAA